MTEEQNRPPIPLPLIDTDTEEWYEGLKRHALLLQQCASCGSLQHPPQPSCAQCLSLDRNWVPASGKGTIFSFIVVRHPVHPAFAEVPYDVILVQLEEGPRILSNMLDCPVEEIEIGMAVEVDFVDVSDDITLPKFRRSR